MEELQAELVRNETVFSVSSIYMCVNVQSHSDGTINGFWSRNQRTTFK